MSVLSHIEDCRSAHKPLLAVLLDPEKEHACEALLPYLQEPDLVLVGGSTGVATVPWVQHVKEHTTRPVVLFPGNVEQFTPNADALLFLSMLNARTPDVLIQPHIAAAMAVRRSGIESIPMGYILLDGGHISSVQRATRTTPLAQQAASEVVSTAVAGELLGKRLIYLEAGSGAPTPVSPALIHAVRTAIHVPLWVGGGICTPRQMLEAYSAGADVVVIGNHFEQHPEQLPQFVNARDIYAHSNL